MLFLKMYYHIMAIMKKIFYKIIYGKHIKFGKKVTFRKGFSLVIEDGAFVTIGDGCFFNNYCSINAKEGINIGNNCLFGENVKIYDHNHVFKYKNELIKQQGFKSKKIEIGSNCWFGSNAIILKGVNIGNNCVIQANSIVNYEVESNTIIIKGNKTKIEMVERNENNTFDEY